MRAFQACSASSTFSNFVSNLALRLYQPKSRDISLNTTGTSPLHNGSSVYDHPRLGICVQ
jgi:hypothetical protein